MESQTVETPTSKIEIQTSKQYAINWRDVLKGAAVAALTVLVATIGQIGEQYLDSIVNGTVFILDKVSLVLSLKAAFGVFVAYLIKNFVTPSQTIVTETKK